MGLVSGGERWQKRGITLSHAAILLSSSASKQEGRVGKG